MQLLALFGPVDAMVWMTAVYQLQHNSHIDEQDGRNWLKFYELGAITSNNDSKSPLKMSLRLYYDNQILWAAIIGSVPTPQIVLMSQSTITS